MTQALETAPLFSGQAPRHHPPCSLSATAGSTVFSSFRMDISTAISTTEPPRIVAIFGTSVNTMNARTGASGVSRALNRAVCPEGTRFAPSANVTEATANSNPNAARTKISNGSVREGAPKANDGGQQNQRLQNRRPCTGRVRVFAINDHYGGHGRGHDKRKGIALNAALSDGARDERGQGPAGRTRREGSSAAVGRASARGTRRCAVRPDWASEGARDHGQRS